MCHTRATGSSRLVLDKRCIGHWLLPPPKSLSCKQRACLTFLEASRRCETLPCSQAGVADLGGKGRAGKPTDRPLDRLINAAKEGDLEAVTSIVEVQGVVVVCRGV